MSAAKTISKLRAEDVSRGSDQCGKCGCTENYACPGGCSWVRKSVCSSCAPAPRRPTEAHR